MSLPVPVDASVERVDPITALRHVLAQADTHRAELAKAGDLESLAVGLAQLRPLLADLRTFTASVEDDVAALMPAKTYEVPGIGVFERRKGSVRKDWDWDALLPVVIRLWVDPDGTGEIPDASVVVDRMRDLITEVIGTTPSKAPKVTPLKARGLDVDEYCSSTPGRSTVQLHGGEK